MSTHDPPPTDPPAPLGTATEQQALEEAVAALMTPLARLAVASGLPYAAVDEMLKLAFVQAAAEAHGGLLPHRRVSRISTATGINRREVTRLTRPQAQARDGTRNGSRSHSLASEVFGHWRTREPYRGADGQPRLLPRQGPSPSFETLAQAVTRDVHPRSLLDELCRLDLAVWDEQADTVALAREIFVPGRDRARHLGFLGDNVGDHLRSAVDNVLRDDRMHFEQAVFADGLSAASLESVRPAIRAQWQALLAALVPALQARVEADRALQPAPRGRIRIGLYTYQDSPAASVPAGPQAPRGARAGKRKP